MKKSFTLNQYMQCVKGSAMKSDALKNIELILVRLIPFYFEMLFLDMMLENGCDTLMLSVHFQLENLSCM